MARSLLALPLALLLAAAFPLNAMAGSIGDAVLQAKGFDVAGSDTGGLAAR